MNTQRISLQMHEYIPSQRNFEAPPIFLNNLDQIITCRCIVNLTIDKLNKLLIYTCVTSAFYGQYKSSTTIFSSPESETCPSSQILYIRCLRLPSPNHANLWPTYKVGITWFIVFFLKIADNVERIEMIL